MNYHFKFLLRTRGLARAIQNESRAPSLARKFVKLVSEVILVFFLVKLARFSFSVFYYGSKLVWGPNPSERYALNLEAPGLGLPLQSTSSFSLISESAIAEASCGSNISRTLSSRMQQLGRLRSALSRALCWLFPFKYWFSLLNESSASLFLILSSETGCEEHCFPC